MSRNRCWPSLATIGSILLLATPTLASPDGGTLDVELLDAGSILPVQMVCMPPSDAQALDIGLRQAEADRDGYKAAVVVIAPLAAIAMTVAVILGASLAAKH